MQVIRRLGRTDSSPGFALHPISMSSKCLLGTIQLLQVLFLCLSCPASLLPGRPFVTVWNAPTSHCWDKFGVALDLAAFDIVANRNQSFVGTEMVIFYSNQLGLYPYYDQTGEPVNGGLPQNASLKDHLDQAYEDMNATMVAPDFQGVAVIDWEDWRPLWDWNWDSKNIYKQHSQELVRQRHPDWSEKQVWEEAKRGFEDNARRFMESTLRLGRKFRPGGLWGFYGFPGCYNYGYKNSSYNYTGECLQVEKKRNNLLRWMWDASRALYPQIYLESMLKMSKYVGPFVKYRLEEAFRVSAEAMKGDPPVLPYARIVYTYSMDFLEQEDLAQTIGQSAALGSAGIILWGNTDYSSSKEACLAVKSYIDDTLGMYVVNVTSAATLCSQSVCTGNGRCVRKDASSEAQLHLHPDSFTITRDPRGSGFLLSGQATKWDILHMAADFQCRCYLGWTGTDCSHRTVS